MNFKEIFNSPKYKKTIIILGILLAILIIFALGMAVGSQRARFGGNWDNNYFNNMHDIRAPFMPFMHNRDILNPHGAIGTVSSIDYPQIVVQGPNQAEQIIIISSSTIFRSLRSQASLNDLQLGNHVTIIGKPDDKGRIEASLIRIVPSPQEQGFSTSTRDFPPLLK